MSELLLASAFNHSIVSEAFHEEAAPLVAQAGKIALILAAGDFRYTKANGAYRKPSDWIEKDTEYIESLRGTAEYLDLRAGEIDSLKLHEFGGFWVGGGNAFVLAQQLHETAVGKEIQQRHERGGLLYIAESAGAVAVADTMNYIWEVPSFTTTNTLHYRELIQYSKRPGATASRKVKPSKGLGISDVKIVPHQDTISPPQHMVFNNNGKIVYLRDGDYYSHARKEHHKR